MSSVRSFMSPFQGFRLYVSRFPRLASGATTDNRSAIRGRSSLYKDSAGVRRSEIAKRLATPIQSLATSATVGDFGYQPPTTNHQPPTTNHQPTTNNQQPTPP